MAKYFVELSARLYWEGEIEADDEAQAIDYAWDEADEAARWDAIDWDVDYVEELSEEEGDENVQKLF